MHAARRGTRPGSVGSGRQVQPAFGRDGDGGNRPGSWLRLREKTRMVYFELVTTGEMIAGDPPARISNTSPSSPSPTTYFCHVTL